MYTPIAHICLEHRPYFTVYRMNNGWGVVDYHGDIYYQSDLPVKESLSRILCLSSPASGHIATFIPLQNYSISSNHFLDMTWSEVENTWQNVIVDIEGVWNCPTVTPSPILANDDLVQLLIEMDRSEPMRLRSGREIYRQ